MKVRRSPPWTPAARFSAARSTTSGSSGTRASIGGRFWWVRASVSVSVRAGRSARAGPASATAAARRSAPRRAQTIIPSTPITPASAAWAVMPEGMQTKCPGPTSTSVGAAPGCSR